MEHVELAGIHSGDSACVIPPVSIPTDNSTDDDEAEYTQTKVESTQKKKKTTQTQAQPSDISIQK